MPDNVEFDVIRIDRPRKTTGDLAQETRHPDYAARVKARASEQYLKEIAAKTKLISRGKTYTADAFDDANYKVDYAFDGNTSTKWQAANLGPHWIKIDLGGEYNISRWVVKHAGVGGKEYDDLYNTAEFALMKSSDGEKWILVDSIGENAVSITDRTVAEFNSRYLCIFINKGNNLFKWSSDRKRQIYHDPKAIINEIEIYGYEAPQTKSTGSAANSNQDGIKNGSYYKIQAKHSGLVIGVENSSLKDGGNVAQYTDNNSSSQIWKIEETSGGYYKIISKNSGKCLDVAGVSRNNGGNLHQWAYGGGDNQQWKIESVGDGYYKIIAKHCGKCVDVGGASKNSGGNIQQWDYANVDNQKWKLIEVK